MGDKTEIAWTDATWNITSGCTIHGPGCLRCYAMKFAHRFSAPGERYEGLTKMTDAGAIWTGEVRLHPDRLDIPLRWQRPRKIFVESMSDVYHDDVPIEFLGRLYATMARAPRHTFQVLTKRTKRRMDLMQSGELETQAFRYSGFNCEWPLLNVWEGSTVVNQAEADRDVPLLLHTPAAVRWLSIEPQLEAIDIDMGRFYKAANASKIVGTPDAYLGLDWVVIGGESGPGARPFNLDWARSLVSQCRAARVAPFFKQAGARPYVTHAAPFVNGPPIGS